jgi:hypothetical protein
MLDPDLDRQAKGIIASMKEAGVKRLIFITALGIYDEVPGSSAHGSGATSARLCRRSIKPWTSSNDP